MGTDIHLEVEVRRDGAWHRLPHPPSACRGCSEYIDPDTRTEPLGYYHPWVPEGEVPAGATVISEEPRNGRVQIDSKEACTWCNGTKVECLQWYHARNYNVFAVLADVRNGRGFGGHRTGSGFEPIASRRGVPFDMSDELLAHLARAGYSPDGSGGLEYDSKSEDEYEELEREPEGYWSLGEHSFSWLTLVEALADERYWAQTTDIEGWVDPWNFELWRRNGRPYDWSGGISGPGIKHISNRAMADMIDSGDLVFEGEDEDWQRPLSFDGRPYTTNLGRMMQGWGLPGGSVGQSIADVGLHRPEHYTLVEWKQTYRESVGKTYFAALEALREHVPEGGFPDDVRLVFGFDS